MSIRSTKLSTILGRMQRFQDVLQNNNGNAGNSISVKNVGLYFDVNQYDNGIVIQD